MLFFFFFNGGVKCVLNHYTLLPVIFGEKLGTIWTSPWEGRQSLIFAARGAAGPW